MGGDAAALRSISIAATFQRGDASLSESSKDRCSHRRAVNNGPAVP
jgi:hypothetical protein